MEFAAGDSVAFVAKATHVVRGCRMCDHGRGSEQLRGRGFLKEGLSGDVNALYQAAVSYCVVETHPNNFHEVFAAGLRCTLTLSQGSRLALASPNRVALEQSRQAITYRDYSRLPAATAGLG